MTLSSSAIAQTMCVPKLAMIEAMANRFSEQETEFGIDIVAQAMLVFM